MEEKKMMMKRVVLVSYPYHGHTAPTFDLASILHSKGFSITIAHSKLNFPNPSSQPAEFTFVKLEDKSDGLDTSVGNQLVLHRVLNERCATQFEDLMRQMMLEDEVACVVYDPLMKFADTVARKLNVKTIAFFTAPAAYVHSNLVFLRLMEQNVFPVPESQADDEIPQQYPLRLSDVWYPTQEVAQGVIDITRSFLDVESATAIIWNTIEFLDGPQLEKIQKQYWQVPFFPIGPLQILARGGSAAKATLTNVPHRIDDTCLSWLDKQRPKSVVYVSFGTMISIDEKFLLDLAWGLAKSEQPFLWSLRRSSIASGDAIEMLPSEFPEMTKDRGLIVEWADQKAVLAHQSVGAFLSHCGWNSIMESLFEGVPLLCRPSVGDQLVNSRYVTKVWKLGIELEKNFDSSKIETSVRALTVGEEGEEIRQRVREAKEKIEECTREGGSSYELINRLVDFINSS